MPITDPYADGLDNYPALLIRQVDDLVALAWLCQKNTTTENKSTLIDVTGCIKQGIRTLVEEVRKTTEHEHKMVAIGASLLRKSEEDRAADMKHMEARLGEFEEIATKATNPKDKGTPS